MPINVAVLWDALRRESGIELRSADLTSEKLGGFLLEIRMQGAAAAQQRHAVLQGEYAAAYAEYTRLQGELEPREKAVAELLSTVDDQLRRSIQQAAKYKLQGTQQRMSLSVHDQSAASVYAEHPKYTAAISGLNEKHREWIEKMVYPLYALRWQVEEAENALWVKHAAVSIAQEIFQLWTYESQAAQMQMGEMEQEVDAEAYRAQVQRHFLERRLEEIRLHNRDRKKRLRQEHFLKKHMQDPSTKSTASSPDKSERKRRSSHNRSEEDAHPSRSRVSGSRKNRSGLSGRKHDTSRQARRASSASPTGSKKSRDKREYKVDPSAWL